MATKEPTPVFDDGQPIGMTEISTGLSKLLGQLERSGPMPGEGDHQLPLGGAELPESFSSDLPEGNTASGVELTAESDLGELYSARDRVLRRLNDLKTEHQTRFPVIQDDDEGIGLEGMEDHRKKIETDPELDAEIEATTLELWKIDRWILNKS
jgi:hypothetical protein